jgi:hypothetical protein
MVVVAIIGVLVTMAIVYVRSRPRPIDVANRIGDMVHEANRRAIALGPVRANVAGPLRSKARTQILGAKIGDDPVTFTLYRLEEDLNGGTTAAWLPLQSYTLPAGIEAVWWDASVVVGAPPASADQIGRPGADWDAPPPVTPTPAPAVAPDGFYVQCRPDGTCDGRTLYFQSHELTGATFERQAKLSILPLGGAITTRPDWN